jgi:Rrf2 family protein
VNLNKSTRYALHAALEMTLAGAQPVTASQVAARYDIPENVVAKVLQQLVRSGLASASRGVGGGYRLARPANEVTVQDVIDLFEPALAPDTCMLRDVPGAECFGEGQPPCRLKALFGEVDEMARATLASVTLATLAG